MGESKSVAKFNRDYNLYYNLVFSLIYRKIKEKSDVNDLCQEVFKKLWENYSKVENKRKWIYGTTNNTLRMYFRNKPHQENIDQEDFENSLHFINGMKDTKIILEDAIKELEFETELEKTIFELLNYKQLSLAQIAQLLDITKSKAYRISLKTKNKLLDILKHKGISELEDLL